MKRAWIGIALLAAAWLMALGYYHVAEMLSPIWPVLVLAGTLLLMGAMPAPQGDDAHPAAPSSAQAGAAAVLLLPVLVVAPWPYKIVPVLLIVGLAGWATLVRQGSPSSRTDRVLANLAGGAIVAGVVLLAQLLVLLGYEAITARSHELPQPLGQLLAALARLLGMNATIDGNNNLVVYAFREPQRFAATWELLVDPATLCFLAGVIAMLTFLARGRGATLAARCRTVAPLVAVVACWLPVRAPLLLAVYMHRLLRTDYDAPLDLMDQFWSTGVHLLLLAGPVVMAAVLVRLPVAEPLPGGAPRRPWPRVAATALAALALAAISAGTFWTPLGTRLSGRVLVDEHHSRWEDTRRPMDTTWYGHLSTYTYSVLYDYCDRFYHMGRIEEPLTDKVLADCDVLVAKLPTSPYSRDELVAMQRFVQRGGGLLLIGEHTNVFSTGQNLNQAAKPFGVQFRYDCLFDVDTLFKQAYRPNVVPHPILRYLPLERGRPKFDFEVACSVDPGFSSGRSAIRSVGLKNLTADYYADNFYPQVDNQPHMRSGAFEQLWTTEFGRGRVAAFGDSTVFSNFCFFEPGKSELFLGMLEWLNHRHTLAPRPWLLATGAVLLIVSLVLAWGWQGGSVLLLAAGLLGWAVAVVCVNAAHARAMPSLQPRQAARPIVQVCFDRQVSGGKLPLGGFISGEEDGYGIFEIWMLRLGYFTHRLGDQEPLRGNLVVFTHPDKPVTDEYRSRLEQFVKEGGRLLVVDSPQNQRSTASSLLWPFGISLERDPVEGGVVTGPAGWPAVPVVSARQVDGGQSLARLGDKTVAAFKRHGKGSVTVIGFGSRFNDLRMGVTADVEPNEEQSATFNLQYALVRGIIEDKVEPLEAATVEAVPSAAAR